MDTEPAEAHSTPDKDPWVTWQEALGCLGAAAAALLATVSWALLMLAVAWCLPDGKILFPNEVGDSFGVVTGTLTACALLGSLASIRMQARELKLTRDEMRKQVQQAAEHKEATRTATLVALAEQQSETARLNEIQCKALLEVAKSIKVDHNIAKIAERKSWHLFEAAQAAHARSQALVRREELLHQALNSTLDVEGTLIWSQAKADSESIVARNGRLLRYVAGRMFSEQEQLLACPENLGAATEGAFLLFTEDLTATWNFLAIIVDSLALDATPSSLERRYAIPDVIADGWDPQDAPAS